MSKEYVKYCYIDNQYRQYKEIPAKYISQFNKLTKVHDSFIIYCEMFEWDDIDLIIVTDDVVQELLKIKISEELYNRFLE